MHEGDGRNQHVDETRHDFTPLRVVPLERFRPARRSSRRTRAERAAAVERWRRWHAPGGGGWLAALAEARGVLAATGNPCEAAEHAGWTVTEFLEATADRDTKLKEEVNGGN